MSIGRPKVTICIQSEELPLLRQAQRSSDAKTRDKARLILLFAERSLSIVGISDLLCRSTRTIQAWLKKWRIGGYKALMQKAPPHGGKARISPEVQQELKEKLEQGVMNVQEVQNWLETKNIYFSYSGTYYWMGKLGRS